MFFTISLYIALGICFCGITLRVLNWFRFNLGSEAKHVPFAGRIFAAIKSILKTVFSLKIIELVKSFVLDVMLQTRLLKVDPKRWLMHILIFGGFMMLLFMHAMDEIVSQKLFSDYVPTVNPYQFLRNAFGALVIVGIVLSLVMKSRQARKIERLTNKTDRIAIVILSVIMLSGFALEASKIVSEPVFNEMVTEYWGADDDKEINLLRLYWAKKYDVAFSKQLDFSNQNDFDLGKQIHDERCAECHSRPVSAFVSYTMAKLLTPSVKDMNNSRADIWLWYIHVLACFIGLAYLPFSKFFHIVTTPISMMIKSVEDSDQNPLQKNEAKNNAANQNTRRISGIDACTHCGVCTLHCSVAPLYQMVSNPDIFPSEKMISLKSMVTGKLDQDNYKSFSEGNSICTNCYRCTTICPSGINLQDLWISSKKELAERGYPEPHVWINRLSTNEWSDVIAKTEVNKSVYMNLADNTDSFTNCVQCTTCTNVCPVVAAVDNPSSELDLTPQQIMNMLRLNQKKLVLASRMVWNCTTCYMCQEHCPEGIKVADILYELRNQAYNTLKDIRPISDNKPIEQKGA